MGPRSRVEVYTDAKGEEPYLDLIETCSIIKKRLIIKCGDRLAWVLGGHQAATNTVMVKCMCGRAKEHAKNKEDGEVLGSPVYTLESWVEHCRGEDVPVLPDGECDRYVLQQCTVWAPSNSEGPNASADIYTDYHGQTLFEMCVGLVEAAGGRALAGTPLWTYWYDQPQSEVPEEHIAARTAARRTDKAQGAWYLGEIVGWDPECARLALFYPSDGSNDWLCHPLNLIHWGPKPPSNLSVVRSLPPAVTVRHALTPQDKEAILAQYLEDEDWENEAEAGGHDGAGEGDQEEAGLEPPPPVTSTAKAARGGKRKASEDMVGASPAKQAALLARGEGLLRAGSEPKVPSAGVVPTGPAAGGEGEAPSLRGGRLEVSKRGIQRLQHSQKAGSSRVQLIEPPRGRKAGEDGEGEGPSASAAPPPPSPVKAAATRRDAKPVALNTPLLTDPLTAAVARSGREREVPVVKLNDRDTVVAASRVSWEAVQPLALAFRSLLYAHWDACHAIEMDWGQPADPHGRLHGGDDGGPRAVGPQFTVTPVMEGTARHRVHTGVRGPRALDRLTALHTDLVALHTAAKLTGATAGGPVKVYSCRLSNEPQQQQPIQAFTKAAAGGKTLAAVPPPAPTLATLLAAPTRDAMRGRFLVSCPAARPSGGGAVSVDEGDAAPSVPLAFDVTLCREQRPSLVRQPSTGGAADGTAPGAPRTPPHGPGTWATVVEVGSFQVLILGLDPVTGSAGAAGPARPTSSDAHADSTGGGGAPHRRAFVRVVWQRPAPWAAMPVPHPPGTPGVKPLSTKAYEVRKEALEELCGAVAGACVQLACTMSSALLGPGQGAGQATGAQDVVACMRACEALVQAQAKKSRSKF